MLVAIVTIVLALGEVFFPWVMTVGAGDLVTTSWGLGDDVVLKIVSGSNISGFRRLDFVWGVGIVVVDDVLVAEFAVFSQSISAGLGDVSATSRGVVDDVASKLAAGGSYWVPTSSIGAGDDVWVLISRFWGSSCCGWPDFSVWVPVLS